MCRYLEDEKAREADEAMVQEIVSMQLRPGEDAELRARIRAFEERASSVQDCTHAHAIIGRGTHCHQKAACGPAL
jgi:DNA repair ATPase RecN